MAQKMLIDATHPEETRVVVVEGNKVEEFDFESINKRQLAGNIYLAKVTRVEPSLQAAFVDYGGNRHGFLAFAEIHPDYYQIPVADREALLAEEARNASEEAEEEERKPVKKRRRSSRSRKRGGDAEQRADDAETTSDESDAAPLDAVLSEDTPAVAAEDMPEAVDTRGEEGVIAAAESVEPELPQAAEEAAIAPAPAENASVADAPAAGVDATVAADAVADIGAEDTVAAEPEAEAPPALDAVVSEDTPSAAADAIPEAVEVGGEEGVPSVATESTDTVPAETVAEAEPDAAEPALNADTAEAAEDTPEDTPDEDAPKKGPSSIAESAGADDDDVVTEEPRAKQPREEARSGEDEGSDEEEEIESVGADDVAEEIRPRRAMRRYKIQEVIKVRQILLVQVVKEERGNKGAALTTYLSLPGRYCVLMPNTARGGGISRKITNAADRKKLKEIASELEVPTGAGLIIRTAGSERTKSEIKRDYEYLMRQWDQVRELTLRSIAPTLIYEEGSLIKRSIRDLYSKDIDEVLVEGAEGFREARDYMKMLMPSHARNVKPYNEPIPLYSRYQVESYLASMFNPIVQLKSGGYIVIGVTEALVAIDVNSGRATREHSIEETALKTNLEAADEVARQLRLRDLAGLIVIDFIDMDERRNNTAVEKRMKERLKSDRARIQIGKISAFGLMEMSRQRLRPGMLEATTAPCPHCHGTGLIRSGESMALTILREIEEEGVRARSKEVLVSAPVSVANYLMNQKRDAILRVEQRYGLSVRIESDPALISPDYRIERFKVASRVIGLGGTSAPVTVDTYMDEYDEAEAAVEIEIETAPAPAPAREEEEPRGPASADDTGAPRKKRRRRRRRGGNGEGRDGESRDGEARDARQSGQDDDAGTDPDETPEARPEEARAAEAEPVEAPAAKAPAEPAEAAAAEAPAEPVAAEATTAPEVTSEPAEAATEEAKPAKPARKPRTRRKPAAKKEAASDALEVIGEEAPAGSTEGESTAIEVPEDKAEAPARKPRARKRPSRSAKAAAEAEAEAAAAEPKPEAEAAAAEAAPETKAPEAEAAPAAEASEAPQPPLAQPEAPAEPQPEAAAADTAPEAEPAPEAETVAEAPAEAEPTDEAPKPRRRGWWSANR
ncbi:ribonuclease E/G [Oceanicella sp. SM1341]|uniref:Rne/Rng family ribonuclease n=1 Tax=Oceanicella sp. SM1341 TaxID=1548889 RepID=UPI000E4C8627|nr:ribonuclease E/G [Oceanicella sp. SM1341]